jgi:hypothetical protein
MRSKSGTDLYGKAKVERAVDGSNLLAVVCVINNNMDYYWRINM